MNKNKNPLNHILTYFIAISFLCILIISCQTNIKTNISIGNQNKKWLNKTNSAKGIHFIYTASKTNSYKGELEVNASLYNDYLDTAFFLSSSCDGIIYSLRYDTTEMDIIPQILCNASFPIILAIPPKEKIDFTFYFGFKKQISSLKLGIDYYSVDKSFKLKEHPEIDLSEIHYRPKYEQVVIWGDEKTIN